ncbi:MAG: polyphenol oxidase family protein [Thermodesulfobacteriota bacterium]
MQYIYFQFPEIENLGCAFTLKTGRDGGCGNLSARAGESSAVIASRREQLKNELGFDNWLEVGQVHGTEMVFHPQDFPQLDPPPQADALATGHKRTGLVIKVADCQPVLLAHRSGKYIAALHVGWRGNRANAPKTWINRFCNQLGLSPGELLAVRGPSLGPQKSEFVNFQEEWGSEFTSYFNPRDKTMNLWELTRDQLNHAGIPIEQIFSLDLCTHTLQHMFFSFRRDRTQYRQTGIIWRQ